MSDSAFYRGVIVVAVLGCIGVVWGVGAISSHSCYAMWKGRSPSWEWFAGCQIDTEQGRIPAQNFRVLD